MQGVHFVRIARSGKPIRWYVYAWRGGPLILKAIGAMRPRLHRADVRAIRKALNHRKAVAEKTLGSVIRQWRSETSERHSGQAWATLSAGTRKTWASALDLIDAKWGSSPLEMWNDPQMAQAVAEWRDSRAATPRAADIGITVLRALLNFARLNGQVELNAAADLARLYRSGQRAAIVWTDEDILKFAVKATELDCEQVVDGLRLAALTGLSRQKLVTVKWNQVGNLAVTARASPHDDGRHRAGKLRMPELVRLLSELKSRYRKPGVETVLVNSKGHAWTGDGFGSSFNRVRDAAGIVHIDSASGKTVNKHLHDVRGTYCLKLLTGGDLGESEISKIMGWPSRRVAAIRSMYVDQSDTMVVAGARPGCRP
jgi:integrase